MVTTTADLWTRNTPEPNALQRDEHEGIPPESLAAKNSLDILHRSVTWQKRAVFHFNRFLGDRQVVKWFQMKFEVKVPVEDDPAAAGMLTGTFQGAVPLFSSRQQCFVMIHPCRPLCGFYEVKEKHNDLWFRLLSARSTHEHLPRSQTLMGFCWGQCEQWKPASTVFGQSTMNLYIISKERKSCTS